jgi:hypothetical protein
VPKFVPAQVILPQSGFSNPPIQFSSVVLPDPDLPAITNNFPLATLKEIFSSAVTFPRPDTYVLEIPEISITAYIALNISAAFLRITNIEGQTAASSPNTMANTGGQNRE